LIQVLDQVFFVGWLGYSPVFVDDSAEDLLPPDWGVEGDHGVGIVAGRVLVEALVWTVVVEVAYVLVEDGAGLLFVVDQHLVGAFFADAADESFCITVGPRCAGRDLDNVEPFGGKDGIEAVGELGVPVADQEAERADALV
jgi:hypothetical protein